MIIVKIQRSQFPTDDEILIYDQSGHWWQGKPDDRLNKWLGKQQKVFAFAYIKNTEFIIERKAPWQEW